MAIAKLTAHRIRHWPQEQVKVLVDSREQQPWDPIPHAQRDYHLGNRRLQ